MSDGLEQMEALAGGLLRAVAPNERRKLLRAVARDIAKSQRTRIATQKQADGAAFANRRARKDPKPGNYAIRFLYPKGSPSPRVAFMKSWVRQGPLVTGFDIEAGGVRSFFWNDIAKWLPVGSHEQNRNAGRLRRRGAIRRAAMFRKLRGPKHLATGSTDDAAWIGFSGRAAEIARIHQYGGEDRVSKNGATVRYAKREILGLTDADRQIMLDAVLAHLNP